MLHEVLLALSGHPSPLFSSTALSQNLDGDKNASQDFLLLSTSEKALLASIGELADLHRKLKHHLELIAREHSSTICRAVATSMRYTHLGRFQKKIIDVEARILTRDVGVVGAYDIVPLAAVVGEFDGWHRRMAWYWEMARFMQPESAKSATSLCSGAALINKLRTEAQTGFPDVEEAAIELSKVAETAWLRQLASFLLYGRLPAYGSQDFFVQSIENNDHGKTFTKIEELLPIFVSSATASSIVFIGKSLDQVKQHGRQGAIAGQLQKTSVSDAQLAAEHLKQMSSLTLPLQSAQLTRAVAAIRLSIFQNVLQHLLPMELTLTLLHCLRRYFLLGRGEFATALIAEAQSRLDARQQSMGRLLQQDPVKALQGLSIKDSELSQVLSQVWKALESRDDSEEDAALDFGRKHIRLSATKKINSGPAMSESVNGLTPQLSSVAFDDVLFPSATSLQLNAPSPLDLFISAPEVDTYSAVNAYLLSIRRAHLRLSDLWRRSSSRRGRPPGQEAANRASQRAVATRKVWATCSAALFLLSETSGYFKGEIIRCSWDHFEGWVKKPANTSELTDDSGIQSDIDTTSDAVQHDPETLASGHRAFLVALIYTLLLTDVPYTRELRSLLGNVDSLVAYFDRLLDCQQKLDLEIDAGIGPDFREEQERKNSLELDRSRKKVDSDLKSVVNRLRQLDRERIGSARYLDLGAGDTGGFEPWKGGGVDRLLMKLEFGRMADEGYDVV